MSKGSQWRKWDLHFHTPSSHDYKDKSVTDQDLIDILHENQVEVVAITDHHIIDIKRIKNLQTLGKDKDISVLPGIEFRSELGGSESIHFIGIFPEDSDLDHIWTILQSQCGLTEKSILDKGGDEKLHCDLKDTCKTIHSLGGLVSVHAGGKTNSIENITNSMPYKMALKTDIVINHIDILELGSEANQNDYIEKVFPVIQQQIPMIICTDNHNIKKYTIKQNLWIKSDPTFQGLKQINFEPSHRVHIGETPPIDPPIRINQVNFDFPEKSFFENDVFCLAGKKEIQLSPNFTCFIGGRGTGKSTILNLIHEKLIPNGNRFFKEKKILNDSNKQISIESSVSVDNDADEKYIEFLGQNEVEEFARDYDKLTSSVYSRIIKRDNEGFISENEINLKKQIQLLNDHIFDKISISALTQDKTQKQKELETNKKIIESFSSTEYIEINSKLKKLSSVLTSISESERKYNLLLKESEGIVEKFKQDERQDIYQKQINIIVDGFESLLNNSKQTDFSKIKELKGTIKNNLLKTRKDLNEYLSDKGLTEENQKDIANAQITTNRIEQEINTINDDIKSLQNKLNKFNIEDVIQSSTEYEHELDKQVRSISEILEKLESSSVKPISLSFEFDEEKALDEIFSDFKVAFEENITQSNHKGDNILKGVLFSLPPTEVSSQTQLLETISDHPSTSAAKSFLVDLFSKKSNCEIYQLIIKLNILNYAKFKKVKVLYDARAIENSSFGQRCTAVLVILLLLGNNPIIIDEPEAHLDSLLISNYLVEVIKDRKRSRQIIFATHNANFVINGDAELIHILNIDESKQTTILTSTTIENPQTRDALIGLEGGIEAFKKREMRYQ